jgi:hypothetical protein
LSQCKPDSVFESEITREMGSELEFPKTWSNQLTSYSLNRLDRTAIATTKFEALLLNLHMRDTTSAAM